MGKSHIYLLVLESFSGLEILILCKFLFLFCSKFSYIYVIILSKIRQTGSGRNCHKSGMICRRKLLPPSSNYFSMLYRLVCIDGSRTAATSKMENFVIIVNGWKSLTIIRKSSILDVAAVLDPSLVCNISSHFNGLILA